MGLRGTASTQVNIFVDMHGNISVQANYVWACGELLPGKINYDWLLAKELIPIMCNTYRQVKILLGTVMLPTEYL